MKTSNETIGIVQKGTVILPQDQHLPDGIRVRVVWEEDGAAKVQPYDRQLLTEAEVLADLDWATGKRFAT